MVDLTCHYGGLKLSNPIIVGSSGFTSSVKQIVELAQAGAGAIVLKSLFEEQIEAKALQAEADVASAYPEGLDYMLHYTKQHEVEQYLDLIREAKKAVSIPIIASINCYHQGEWAAFAQQVEQAGADALEVNVMRVETDPSVSGGVLEEDYAKLAQCVVRAEQIPVVFKLPDTFTNVTYVAGRLAAAGVKGVTCFNKVWQTDINIDTIEMEQGPVISSGRELYKTLKYTGLLSALLPQLQVSASGGVMTSADVVKSLLAGASSVQVVSTLYLHRAAYIQDLLRGVSEWMSQHGFLSIDEFRGRLDASRLKDRSLYERSQFMRYFSDFKENPVGDI